MRSFDQYELYYTADSTYFYESRSKNTSRINLAAKTPLCTDILPITHITSHADVRSPSEFRSSSVYLQQGKKGKTIQPLIPTFVVKKVFDSKPRAGGEFIGEIEWMEVWKRGLEEGEWDTEEIGEGRGEEEESEVDEEQNKVDKKRNAKRKAMAIEEGEDDDSESAEELDGDDVYRADGEVCGISYAHFHG